MDFKQFMNGDVTCPVRFTKWMLHKASNVEEFRDKYFRLGERNFCTLDIGSTGNMNDLAKSLQLKIIKMYELNCDLIKMRQCAETFEDELESKEFQIFVNEQKAIKLSEIIKEMGFRVFARSSQTGIKYRLDVEMPCNTSDMLNF